MKTIIITCIISLFIISGCTSPDAPEVKVINAITLSTGGTKIGTLPDGREIVQYKIDRGSKPSHYIYVVNGSITLNVLEQEGKSQILYTESYIDN